MRSWSRTLVAVLAAAPALALPGIAAQRPARPVRLTPAERAFVQGDNRFAIAVFRAAVRRTSANVVLSPFSLATALALTADGANGATEAAMRRALGTASLSREDADAAARQLTRRLLHRDPHLSFAIASSIWYRPGLVLNPAFQRAARAAFGAELAPLDFDAPAAAERINGWVSRQTNRRIEAIVPAPLPDDAVLYLINAVYFKGTWTRRFAASLTEPAPFRLDDGSTVQVPLMTFGAQVPVRTSQAPDASVLELPYGTGDIAMVVALPREGVSVDSLVARLTPERWNAWTDRLAEDRSGVFLPRLRLATTLEPAIPILKSLGVTSAFCDEPAHDFTRMDPSGRTCVSDVRHRAFVLVDENGTEAAAATAVGVSPTAYRADFRVDRPFLFAIRERSTGIILFLGCVRNPAAG